jgi:hypothetical protein
VGYKLRREIEDLFPGACTPAERLVGLEIAEYGHEATRISLMPIDLLCSRTGMSPDGVKKALQRLLSRGLEFRISHGKGRDGRPVYSKRGAPPEYRVPSADEFLVAAVLEGGTTVPPSWLAQTNGRVVDKPP